VPDAAVETIARGDGNDTVFLSTTEGDTAENYCENINPPSFKIANEAQILLGNATENSQSKKADIDQNSELAFLE